MSKVNRHLLVLTFALVASVTSYYLLPTHAVSVRKSAGEILFTTSNSNQNPEIYSIRGDGSGLRKISRQPLGCIGASWSPDKKSVVLAIATKTDSISKGNFWRYKLAIMDVRSGKVRNLKIPGMPQFGTFSPAFSPSGKEIIFLGMPRHRFIALYKVNRDGSHLKQLTRSGKEGSGHFSPDGKKIVFTTSFNGQENVCTMNTDGTKIRRLTNSKGDQTPVWSPSEKQIAFVSWRSGSYQIYVMNSNGSAQRRLTQTKENNFTPTFNPDGKQIAFTRRGKVATNRQIYVMNADGTRQKRITYIKSRDSYYPAWR